METKYWYVEVSATPEGMINIEKFCTDSLLHSYVDVEGILHKRLRVASTFSLDSMQSKNIIFDYMEDNGGLDKYGLNKVSTNKRGISWRDITSKEYNLMYGKNGRLSAIYTDSSNVNTLLKLKDNKGRLSNNKKTIPTNRLECCIKRGVRSIININRAIKNASSSSILNTTR